MEAEAEAGAVMVSEMVTEVEEPVRAEGGASVAVVTAVGATAADGGGGDVGGFEGGVSSSKMCSINCGSPLTLGSLDRFVAHKHLF